VKSERRDLKLLPGRSVRIRVYLRSEIVMRDLIKSTLRFSWAMSLFGVQQLENMVEDASHQDSKTMTAFESVSKTTEEQIGGVVKDAYKSGERLQSRMVDMILGTASGQPEPTGSTTLIGAGPIQQPTTDSAKTTEQTPRVNSGRLNTTTFVVLGEGLAAGMGDFTLTDETQVDSFPAQMARQMQAQFPQRLIQAPGIGNPVGFAELPVIVPSPMQTTVLDRLPATSINNLSVPGYTLSDSLKLRPSQPVVQRNDAKQTAANLILGIVPIAYGEVEQLRTQLESAVTRKPTFIIIELGYYEALEAAVLGDPRKLPHVNSFRADYARLLKSLKVTNTEILVLTIPNPFDTAHFSSVNVAAKILKLEPAVLLSEYKLRADDLITASGLIEIGCQLLSKKIRPLPDGYVLKASVAAEVRRRVDDLNAALTSLAGERQARVYDLHALFQRVRNEGTTVGSRRLTAEYLGGFYSLNGYYPGATGQALIANELLSQMNNCYGSDFRQIDLREVMQNDPVAAYRQAEGPNWPADQLSASAAQPESSSTGHSTSATESMASTRAHNRSAITGWEKLPEPQAAIPPKPLQLPPGLEQVLPVSKAASYFGDSIRAVNCRNKNEIPFGSCRGTLFGGFAMVDSHLSGAVRIKFTPPVNNMTHFEVTHGEGLLGDDGTLSAPQFFKLPALQNGVKDVPGKISSGDLNLETGEVSNPKYYFYFGNSALLALGRVNPDLPAPPTIVFAEESTLTQYSSATATFEQRSDGLLDYSFYGSTFLPLGSVLQGQPVLFPLPISSPTLQFASVPANGTALHPHISVSTKEPEVWAGNTCPDVPFNSVQELTLFTHNTSFGDAFTFSSPVLGGNTTGRSQVLGRVLLQFGQRAGNSVPVAVSFLNPGGLLIDFPVTPITELFPGRLYPGPRGCDEILRFPLRSYSLDDLAILDDPFDISVGAVDLRSGKFLNDLLHRGFINQNVFFALIRVEPRTPRNSFYFRGPTVLETGANGRLIFRFKGTQHLPYPEDFLFPDPNLATGFRAGPNSALDPFLWIHAIEDGESPQTSKAGSARNVLSSTAERFSYSYKIPSDLSRHQASFEYENHTQQGKFRMHSLSWVGFSNSSGARHSSGDYDTVTFSGFGVWSKDGSETVQMAAVQISTSPQRPYVAIQIDDGDVSNVNTKPQNIDDVTP
jgi:hypothetical protein